MAAFASAVPWSRSSTTTVRPKRLCAAGRTRSSTVHQLGGDRQKAGGLFQALLPQGIRPQGRQRTAGHPPPVPALHQAENGLARLLILDEQVLAWAPPKAVSKATVYRLST